MICFFNIGIEYSNHCYFNLSIQCIVKLTKKKDYFCCWKTNPFEMAASDRYPVYCCVYTHQSVYSFYEQWTAQRTVLPQSIFFFSPLYTILIFFFSIAKAMTPLSHLCWEITQYDLTSSTSLLWAMNVWNCDLIKVGKTSNSKIKLNVESNQ